MFNLLGWEVIMGVELGLFAILFVGLFVLSVGLNCNFLSLAFSLLLVWLFISLLEKFI